MSTWDLVRIRYTVRKLAGKFDTNQLPDNSPAAGAVTVTNPPGIDDYINDFYLYDLPESFRTLKLRQFYTFTTVPNCGTYTLPQWINQVYDPIYVDNYRFAWYQYPEQFYQVWPEFNQIKRYVFSPVDGQRTYTFTLPQATNSSNPSVSLTNSAIQQGSVVIGLTPNIDGQVAGGLETFRDRDQPIPLDVPVNQYFVNPGTLTGNQGGTGTIDYLTGVVNLTYANPFTSVTAQAIPSAHYHVYQASRSSDILYWQNQLFLRPIPNDTYLVKVMAYVMPTVVLSAATNATELPSFTSTSLAPGSSNTGTINGFDGSNPQGLSDLPNFSEWWQLIAYGTARKIMIEEGDWDEVSKLDIIFEQQKLLAQRKTLKQLGSQRIPTRYSDNVPYGQGGSNIFPYY